MTYEEAGIKLVDENEMGEKLYIFPENDLFPEFAIFENCEGEIYFPSDMWGWQPSALDDVPQVDWYPIADIVDAHKLGYMG